MGAPPAGEVLAFLRRKEDEMVTLLERLAVAESPSLEPAAQRSAFTTLAAELERLPLAVRRVRGNGVGDHLYARPPARARGAPVQLLIGHLDTVWPLGTLESMPVRRNGDRLHGPGVFDMKAGLVQMAFALGALVELEISTPAVPVVLVASDEEIGSGDSRRHLARLARLAARAFVLEPAFGPAGKLKTARKGVGRFTITAEGRAAHAGVSPAEGVSAILEIAQQVQRLFELNEPASGVTVNVGTIDGGLRPNMIAPLARAVVDVRVPTGEDAARLEAAIRALRPVHDAVSLRVEGGFGRPPMARTERNAALWETARRIGEDLGIALDETAVGGASDGNLTSLTTATLDGLGAVGEGAHARHEYILVSRMPERAALLTLLLASPLAPPVVSRSPSLAAEGAA